ncbi:MAG: hypothetical protein JNL21_14340 [Myxococcales bacterium]|nr:hypothetical protein [Myxococcales bacterium]
MQNLHPRATQSAAPLQPPTVEVYDQGVFIVTLVPGLELRGVLIDDSVWFAWFMAEKPMTEAKEAARA